MSLAAARSGMLGVDRRHAGGGVVWLSLEQIRAFLEASSAVGFRGRHRAEVYGWVDETLRVQHYEELKRAGRRLVRRYVEK